ncbi:unnamed protein product [Hydatigera taeniaeformis]|uniref:Fibronectin type-III domain-containing protein n=1 Tax=Hydatigena taeniaeformis TaxID=6205 RepID=A0A158REZ8_HYDTA|nr:unnamed protein product [Hydatigera taeniaeformis]
MVFSFCFLLLTTYYIAAADESSESAADNLLPQHFYWNHIDPHSIELKWDVDKLDESYADLIEVSAVATTAPFRVKSVPFSLGTLTLEDLQPDTTYHATVKALSIAGTVFTSNEVFRTPPIGKSLVIFSDFASLCSAISQLFAAMAKMEDGFVTKLPQHYRWIRVDWRSIDLGWDVDALSGLRADEMKLTAYYYTNSINYVYQSVPFLYDNLTPDRVKSSTLNEMHRTTHSQSYRNS